MPTQECYGPVLVQSFDNFEEANAAVRSLLEAGCTAADVSVVLNHRADFGETQGGLDALVELLASGGQGEVPELGPVLGGPLVPLLDPERATTERSRRLSHVLFELGVEKEEAKHFQRQARAGEIIVVASCALSSSLAGRAQPGQRRESSSE